MSADAPQPPLDAEYAAMVERRQRFFARPMPPGYAEEWAKVLAEPSQAAEQRKDSMLEFRIGGLTLALSTRWVKAVTPPLTVCRVPHRDNTAFLGLVAYAGEVIPCCSLARILGAADAAQGAEARTVVVEQAAGERWAFSVDSVLQVSTGKLHDRDGRGEVNLPDDWSECLFEDERGATVDVLRAETLFARLERAIA